MIVAGDMSVSVGWAEGDGGELVLRGWKLAMTTRKPAACPCEWKDQHSRGQICAAWASRPGRFCGGGTCQEPERSGNEPRTNQLLKHGGTSQSAGRRNHQ